MITKDDIGKRVFTRRYVDGRLVWQNEGDKLIALVKGNSLSPLVVLESKDGIRFNYDREYTRIFEPRP
jgi:hypothetical protein